MNEPYRATFAGIRNAALSRVADFMTRGVDADRAKRLRDAHEAEAREAVPNDAWAQRLAAAELIERYARRAAVRSLLTGLPGGWLAIPLSLVEAQGAFSARLELAVALRLLVDDDYTKQPDWRQQILLETFELDAAAAAGMRAAALRAAREVALKRGMRFVTRRLGQRLVPVVGGAIGAAATYAWIHREGRRMARGFE
ncbi:MAG: hypothetical protein AAF645_30580 [Myxococcota bacterium]